MNADETPDPNREAAKYRRQLREVEAKRDKITATLEAAQRSRVEAVAVSQGITADALWAAGSQLDALLTADGQPDADAIAAAVQHTRDYFGITVKPATAAGLKSGAMAPQPTPDNWRDAFGPKR